MIVLSHEGRDVELPSGSILTARYARDDGRVGRANIRLIDRSNGSVVESTVYIEPWDADGFLAHESSDASWLVLCGANAVVVLDAEGLAQRASLPFEHQECENIDQPWITSGEGVTLIATDSRVACIDERRAIRWIWSTRVGGEDWSAIVGPPRVGSGRAFVSTDSQRGLRIVELDIRDARRVN